MSEIKPYAALSLCAAMMLSLLACSDSSDPQTEDSESISVTVPATETVQPKEPVPEVPDTVQLEGRTLHVLNALLHDTDTIYFDAKEFTGDIVNDASYNRMLSVSDRLNCGFDSINIHLDDLQEHIIASVTADSNDYDFILGQQYYLAPLVLQDMFMNLHDLPYIDITDPWWSEEYINELSIGDSSRYFLGGDISTLLLRGLTCMYVNKMRYQELFDSPDALYQEVLDKTWTFDRLHELTTEGYVDLDGDSKRDRNDRYGCCVITVIGADQIAYSSGVRCTTRDDKGIPQLTMNNPHTIDLTEKAYRLFYENEGTFLNDRGRDTFERFCNDQYMFVVGSLGSADYLRTMKNDFGIIPFPLFDENQEEYLSLITDSVTIAALPITAQKTDETAAVLELLAYEGWKHITPAYYEITLKTKYSRETDPVGVQMLDIIHDSAMTDFGYAYNYALDDIAIIHREILCTRKNDDFASAYAKKEASAKAKLDELVTHYLSLNQ